MNDGLRVIQVGMGAMGRRLTPFLLQRPSLDLVGAVDIAPEVIGQDLGDVAGLGGLLGIRVCGDLKEAFAPGTVDVAVLTTVSGLAAAVPQIEALVDRGANVVSSCEELSYPWETAPELSEGIDRRAKAAGVSVLGTGVNPGFLMDLLPIALTAICREVTKITVLRYQDARFRRLPFQKKIGAGLTPAEFEQRKSEGTLRHVGLTESMHMVASRMGWKLQRTEDVITPVIAEREVRSDQIVVAPGSASGVCQVGLGYEGREERIRLEFRACLGEEEVQDTVIVEGTPGLRFTIPGGVNGDIATCAILTNAIPVTAAAPPGLRTMADIPPVSWFRG